MNENEEKLKELMKFLDENGIVNVRDAKVKGFPVDLLLPKMKIAIHLSDMNDQLFFRRMVKYRFNPFFIRDTESVEFIIEKAQNCIYDVMMRKQKWLEKSTNKQNKQ